MANIITTVTDFVKRLYDTVITMLSYKRQDKYRNSVPPEIQARLRVQKLLDYNQGMMIDYLRANIDKLFIGHRFKNELMYAPTLRNIVEYLANTVPYTFREGCLVNLPSPKDQAILENILDDNQWDSKLRQLERMVYLCKTVFMKVSWNSKTEKVFFEIITPEHVKVESKEFEPKEIEKIGYPIKLRERSIDQPKGIFAVWTEQNFYFTDEDGVVLNDPLNPSNVNPYDLIPIVTFRESEPLFGEFFVWPGEELINAQDNLNVKLTFRSYLNRKFNIPLLVGVNCKIKNEKEINADGSEIILISNDGLNPSETPDLKFVTPTTKIDDVNSVIEDEQRAIMIEQGIDPNLYLKSADRQSGLSIAEMNLKLEERRQIQKLMYQYGIEEFMEIVRVVHNMNTTDPEKKLSETDKFTVTIPEPKPYYASAQDKWIDRANSLEMNIKTPIDFVMEDRNDLNSRAEAEQAIADNAKYNREIKLTSRLTGQPILKPPQGGTQNAGI